MKRPKYVYVYIFCVFYKSKKNNILFSKKNKLELYALLKYISKI